MVTFGKIDHVYGALTVRLHRRYFKIKKIADLMFFLPDLAVGGVSELELIKKAGIDAILDMRHESMHDEQLLKKLNMQYLRLGVHDREVPSHEDVKNTINWIDEQRKQHRKILIHCNLGRGRGPLMAILYLISQGLDRHDSILKIKKIRKYTYLNKMQLNYIEKYA